MAVLMSLPFNSFEFVTHIFERVLLERVYAIIIFLNYFCWNIIFNFISEIKEKVVKKNKNLRVNYKN